MTKRTALRSPIIRRYASASNYALRSKTSRVGEQRKTQLLRHFGSLKQVREASLEALSRAPGLPQSVARAVYDYFHAAPEETRHATPSS